MRKSARRREVIYTLDTLEYLARGGRIGRVKAMAGALLNLKPVIRVDTDGKYSTVNHGAHVEQIHHCHCRTSLQQVCTIHLSGSPSCMVASQKKRKCWQMS